MFTGSYVPVEVMVAPPGLLNSCFGSWANVTTPAQLWPSVPKIRHAANRATADRTTRASRRVAAGSPPLLRVGSMGVSYAERGVSRHGHAHRAPFRAGSPR